MSDDYLWDGSGKPDPDVERLEKLLGRFRHAQPAPAFPLPEKVAEMPRPRLLALWPRFAAVAAILLMAVGAWYFVRPRAAWDVETLAGTPRVGSNPVGTAGKLPVGEWLITDGESRAEISVDVIGVVQVEPNTRIGLLRARTTDHRLSLHRGKIFARIWAPPRLFSVETPSALAVDLGCKYTLEVDEAGAGFLHVTMGWVAFEYGNRESFVPEGAMCLTRPGVGPGTPYFEDALEALRTALYQLDFELAVSSASSTGDAETVRQRRAAALATLLEAARPRDALTLWHLLARSPVNERGAVYDRMAVLVPPPAGVTRESVLRGDRKMLDLWWDELGLKSAIWWRMWKGPWPGRSN